MPTESNVKALVDAMWQLLDDMGTNGASVCRASKAQARVAFEPFRDNEPEYEDWMSLDEAKAIILEIAGR